MENVKKTEVAENQQLGNDAKNVSFWSWGGVLLKRVRFLSVKIRNYFDIMIEVRSEEGGAREGVSSVIIWKKCA